MKRMFSKRNADASDKNGDVIEEVDNHEYFAPCVAPDSQP